MWARVQGRRHWRRLGYGSGMGRGEAVRDTGQERRSGRCGLGRDGGRSNWSSGSRVGELNKAFRRRTRGPEHCVVRIIKKL